MAYIDIQNVTYTYPLTKTPSIADVNLSFERGKFYAILGANGSGKTTLCNIIRGFIPNFFQGEMKGKVIIDGKNLEEYEMGEIASKIGYVFQNPFNQITGARDTVYGEIAYGLENFGVPVAEIKTRVEKIMEITNTTYLQEKNPFELSGGQQQRVALARIMAYEPSVILLDEPFSALDVFLKDRLQQEMMELLSDYDGTVILVSHSRDEIYRFSEELLVIDDGKQICYGDTKAIFDCPEQVEAARLTGCKNIVRVKRLDEHSIEIPDWGTRLHLEQEIDAEITHIGLRAHEFIPVWGEREDNCIPVKEKGKAEFPFEWKYFLKGETEESDDICWYVQKNLWDELTEKGIPDYLKLPEKEILLLK